MTNISTSALLIVTLVAVPLGPLLAAEIPIVVFRTVPESDSPRPHFSREDIVTEENTVDDPRYSTPPIVQIERFGVDSDELAQNFQDFLERIGDVFDPALATVGSYSVDQIELHIDMSATGGFALVGRAEAGVSSGIKVVLKRQ